MPTKANILINDHREACLADFGLAIALQGSATVTTTLKGTLRWMAPELLKSSDPDGGVPTCASDVYALAMVFYEVRAKALYLVTGKEVIVGAGRCSQGCILFPNCDMTMQ